MKKLCLLLVIASGMVEAMEHRGPLETPAKTTKKQVPVYDPVSGEVVLVDVSKPTTGNVVMLPGSGASPIQITRVLSGEEPMIVTAPEQSLEARRVIQPLTYEGERGFNVALQKRLSDEELRLLTAQSVAPIPSTSRDISYMQELPEEEPTGGE